MLPENKRILLLSPYVLDGGGAIKSVLSTLERHGHSVASMQGPVTYDIVADYEPLFILSYGYRHKIPQEVWASFNTANLHISALPWNRGADPNLWSWIDDTPKGVTLHWVDGGWDTGPIIASWHVPMQPETDTLETSYTRLHEWAADLLETYLGSILQDWPMGDRQRPGAGSFHYAQDRSKVEHLLTAGWETPVRDLIGKGRGL